MEGEASFLGDEQESGRGGGRNTRTLTGTGPGTGTGLVRVLAATQLHPHMPQARVTTV